MEKNMEDAMGTGGIKGVKELNLRYYLGESLFKTTYTQ